VNAQVERVLPRASGGPASEACQRRVRAKWSIVVHPERGQDS
jgi:hypothetical protein